MMIDSSYVHHPWTRRGLTINKEMWVTALSTVGWDGDKQLLVKRGARIFRIVCMTMCWDSKPKCTVYGWATFLGNLDVLIPSSVFLFQRLPRESRGIYPYRTSFRLAKYLHQQTPKFQTIAPCAKKILGWCAAKYCEWSFKQAIITSSVKGLTHGCYICIFLSFICSRSKHGATNSEWQCPRFGKPRCPGWQGCFPKESK